MGEEDLKRYDVYEKLPYEGCTKSPYEVGKSYFIRTVTMAIVGKLEGIHENELVLSSASWVADSGRFSEVFTKGLEASSNSEIEPFKNNVIVGRGAIVDCSEYDFELPNSVKPS